MIRVWRFGFYTLCIGSWLITTISYSNLLDDYLHEELGSDTVDQDLFDDIDGYNDFFTSAISKQLPPEVIIGFLLSLDALKILQTDFFIHTNPLNKRSILDSPLFEYRSFTDHDGCHLQAEAFYNKTDRYNFTAKSDKICSYVALSSPTLIGAIVSLLENVNALVPNFFDFDVPTVFKILQKIRIEERNLGIMISGVRQWKRGYFQIMTPLMYHERNFFLTTGELDELADELGESEPDFQKKHVISDKLGLGDTRIETGMRVVEKPSIECIVGMQATIPTAFTIAKCIFGNHFNKSKFESYPEVDFDTIYRALEHYLNHTIDLREKQNVIDIAREFIIGVIDRIAANLIDDPLGNGGHLGLGIFATSQSPLTCFFMRQWAEPWWWHNRMSLEYLWPKNEKRFYINQNDPQSFAKRNFADPAQAASNLIFLQNELINRVYLLAITTMVQPGLIFRWTSSFNYQAEHLKGGFGTNLWVQQAEKLYDKTLSQCTSTTIDQLLALDMCKVKAPVALQLKLFGDIAYTFKQSDIAWTIGVNGDITAVKHGIGRDYTLGLFVEALW